MSPNAITLPNRFLTGFTPGLIDRKDGGKRREHKGQSDHQRGDHLLFRGVVKPAI